MCVSKAVCKLLTSSAYPFAGRVKHLPPLTEVTLAGVFALQFLYLIKKESVLENVME